MPMKTVRTSYVNLTPLKIKALADEMGLTMRPPCTLLADTDVRQGNMLALRCADVDLDALMHGTSWIRPSSLTQTAYHQDSTEGQLHPCCASPRQVSSRAFCV